MSTDPTAPAGRADGHDDRLLSRDALRKLREIDTAERGTACEPLSGFSAMAHRSLLLDHVDALLDRLDALEARLEDAQEIIAAIDVGHDGDGQWFCEPGDVQICDAFRGQDDRSRCDRASLVARANTHAAEHRARVEAREREQG